MGNTCCSTIDARELYRENTEQRPIALRNESLRDSEQTPESAISNSFV